jgi:uncharacterized protein DUF6471
MLDADRLAHKWVKCLLRSEMVRHGVSYAALAKRLVSLGVVEEEGALRNRISRGKFSAAFFFQCLAAIGTRNVNVDLHDYILNRASKEEDDALRPTEEAQPWPEDLVTPLKAARRGRKRQ